MKDDIVLFNNKKECCGCGTCSQICPKNAIIMCENDEGFVYPSIDKSKCIKCGLCQRKCPLRSEFKCNEKRDVYIGATEDNDIINKSASGGIFSTIAKRFILNGGVVSGCTMKYDDKKFIIEHILIEDINCLEQIQGSKYVQSNIQKMFPIIKEYLTRGKKVLFSGTSCQIAALYSYLKESDISLLYTIDIICHGNPSQKMFNDYIKYIEKKNNIEIIDFNFRNKEITWKHCGNIVYRDKNGILKNRCFIPQISSYYKLFLDTHIYRDSCYDCHFANKNRISDITLGDFWGVEKEHPEVLIENGGKLNKQKGISFVCVNSEKGTKLLKDVVDEVILINSNYSKAAKHNHQLIKPINETKTRKKVLSYYKKYGYKGVDRVYKRYIGLKLLIYLMKNKRIKRM